MSPLPMTVAVGCVALSLGALLTEPLRRFALRYGVTDRPNGRKGHARPTPYLGGIAVAVVTLAAGAATAFAGGFGSPGLAVLLGGAAVMAVLGLIDDLRPLGPVVRLGVEATAATAVVLVGGHPTLLGGPLDAVIAVLWIVFTTNAFNLLDNMDGASSSVGAVVGVFLCWQAWWIGQAGLGLVLVSLSGACLGFLLHNWHPARIFLGDSGSLFIGFTVACAAVLLHKDAAGLAAPAGLLAATLVVTVDTALVMLSRYREARPLLQGGLDHASHRLRRMGLTVRQTALLIGAFAAVGGLSGVLLAHGVLPSGGLLLAATVLGLATVALLLRVPSAAVTAPSVAAAGGVELSVGRQMARQTAGGAPDLRKEPSRIGESGMAG
ncbi:undecaprenyl/decaprenyl-phosphate alpha-N-acetylglucosaminyl 1-phosphate transferase [Streptomyces sp. HUCO-GS316]|uniref:MraY family glycosyltransferase n=1 Tax=Streptomyces sp. HUCO-GS316 TaxID=2692198 RepID=UPI00136C8C5E|nr:MraY family glycosyltransferase [Streptomyces sp. HUCO-GS316]MXM63465.1 undecaprenyl/decaprenyl-phosphate alpha-N-acetylglucosaminyl 1-phosphate transferase [Streptomyces sp. HUCO-GS316]